MRELKAKLGTGYWARRAKYSAARVYVKLKRLGIAHEKALEVSKSRDFELYKSDEAVADALEVI